MCGQKGRAEGVVVCVCVSQPTRESSSPVSHTALSYHSEIRNTHVKPGRACCNNAPASSQDPLNPYSNLSADALTKSNAYTHTPLHTIYILSFFYPQLNLFVPKEMHVFRFSHGIYKIFFFSTWGENNMDWVISVKEKCNPPHVLRKSTPHIKYMKRLEAEKSGYFTWKAWWEKVGVFLLDRLAWEKGERGGWKRFISTRFPGHPT